MKIYNHEFLSDYTNAVITVSVRTDKGGQIAGQIALEELTSALESKLDSWYIDTISEEDF